MLTPARIDADDELDVVNGCAGAMLALLALAREQMIKPGESGRALELAVDCGQRLMNRRVAYKR